MGHEPLDSEILRLRADNTRRRGHRITSTFAIFRAIVRRSADSGHSTEDFAAHLDGRLDALLRLHSTTMRNPQGGVDLYAILANELLAHAAQEGRLIGIEGSDVQLPERVADIIGLAIHELTVNSVKFGALTCPDARVDIGWRLEPGQHDDDLLVFTWIESGLTDIARKPPTRGFGLEVLTVMLPYQIKAKVRMTFEPDGLHCEIVVPLLRATIDGEFQHA